MEFWFPNGISSYLIGGLLLGAGMSLLFVATGLIGGMSTVFTTTWSYVSKVAFFNQPRFISSRSWRLVYAAGLILGALLWLLVMGRSFQTAVPWWQLLLGGIVAGFGARLANGCTAGHGICGMASLQLPSLLAVLTFMATAILTANFMHFFRL